LIEIEGGGNRFGSGHADGTGAGTRAGTAPACECGFCAWSRCQGYGGIVVVAFRTIRTAIDACWGASDRAYACSSLADCQRIFTNIKRGSHRFGSGHAYGTGAGAGAGSAPTCKCVSSACGCRQGDGGIVVIAFRTIRTAIDASWRTGDCAGTCASLADSQRIFIDIEGGGDRFGGSHGDGTGAGTGAGTAPTCKCVSRACGCRQGDGGIVVVALRTIRTAIDACWGTRDRASTRASLADGQHVLLILKVAVTNLAVVMLTVHVPVPVQAPLQPANVCPVLAAAVRVTEVL